MMHHSKYVRSLSWLLKLGLFSTLLSISVRAADDAPATATGPPPGERMVKQYFREETAKLSARSLSDVRTLDDWLRLRGEYRRQLFEMFGLDPLPEKSPLNASVTGTVERDGIVVENVAFQSLPGLYVTGNLYRPQKQDGKLPAILYLCGHKGVKKGGVSYGNKANYQYHGAWFARNGYVCLMIDSLQLGEIEGIHHGTVRYDMWWWNARGYSPAGVEAWNAIRALDYLESRPEVDTDRIGVTGRSGGGSVTWSVTALDDRVKVAVPVAGITTLKNHIVDGCIEGHCDCMFFVNTYRWDFPMVAALAAPRPLLISNSDKDSIFPLDGVLSVHAQVRRIYELYHAEDKLGLQITEGPHKDTQELRVAAFHWFNRFLKGEDPLIEMTAASLFKPEELQVFRALPTDEVNTKIHETFVPKAGPPPVPQSVETWNQQRNTWIEALRKKVLRGWPDENQGGAPSPEIRSLFSFESRGIQFSGYEFQSQEGVRLPLYLIHRAGLAPAKLELVVLNAVDDAGWKDIDGTVQAARAMAAKQSEPAQAAREKLDELTRLLTRRWGMAYVAPRGIGPTQWGSARKNRIHIRRRFMLLGQTLDGMRVWDVRRAFQVLSSLDGLAKVPLWMQGEDDMAVITLYASLFEPNVHRLDLWRLVHSHREGPDFLNVLRILDVPQAVAMAAEKSQVVLYQSDKSGWEYPESVARTLGWPEKNLRIRIVDPSATSQ